MYESLIDRRYREWMIFHNRGISPEAKYTGYGPEYTLGTITRLPRANMMGVPNLYIYMDSVIAHAPPRRELLDMLGVRFVVRLNAPARRYDELAVGAQVSELKPLPRAFVVSPPTQSLASELRETLVARAEGGNVRVGSATLPARPATIVDYQAERVEVKVDVPEDGILVLSDLFHPFWEARIDGRPAEIFPMFHIMRGVAVPAGAHRVEFTCRVPGLKWALAASIAILLASLVAAVMEKRLRRP
jgi:hypothetical protein